MTCNGERPSAQAFARARTLVVLLLFGAGCAFDTSALAPSSKSGQAKASGKVSVTNPGTSINATGSAGAQGGAVGLGGASASTGGLPCDVATVVKAKCQLCHAATPVGGAPMPLVTLSDFQRDYVVKTTQPVLGQTIKMYELTRIRINAEMGTPRMPEGSQLAAPDLATMNDWLLASAPAGDACGGSSPGGGGGNTAPDGGTITNAMDPNVGGGSAPGDPTMEPKIPGNRVITPDTPDECANDPTQFQPLVARPGETCYEFRVHGTSSTTDTSKFTVQTGESYNEFYYAIPWPKGTLATRFGAKFDNLQVAHHWLGFSTQTSTSAPGTVAANVLGTTLFETAELIGGWAVGGCNVVFPPEMGLKLPDSGEIMIQWHHFNSTGTTQKDATAVQWCTVPSGSRANVGGLTFLGTENFDGIVGMPPGVNKFGGTCTNNSGKPITIVGLYPHMHLIGVNMKSEVTKAAGGSETIFDHPFAFDHQVNYMINPGYVLQPKDKITSTCTFNNTTTANVAFGQSTKQEMCYQFTFAYPYGALNNGVISLIGATNTCW